MAFKRLKHRDEQAGQLQLTELNSKASLQANSFSFGVGRLALAEPLTPGNNLVSKAGKIEFLDEEANYVKQGP